MKLVAFDWDQTLWNSWDVHVAAAQYAAGVLGLVPPSNKCIAANFSVPFSQHMELLFPENTREAREHYLEFYHSRVRVLGSLFEGVPEMLRALRDKGLLLALLSDKREVYGSQELESTGIGGLFHCVLFLEDGRAYKPDPAGLRQVMASLGVPRDRVLYVGDSYVDVLCARRAGAASGAAMWGSVDGEAALNERPDYVLHSVADVAALTPGMGEY